MNLLTGNETALAERFDVTRESAPAPRRWLIGRDHPLREQAEAFIARRFLDVHGARVTSFMPSLLALTGEDGDMRAALGIRSAGFESLFLEYYLDLPVERVLAEQAGMTVAPLRERIVEIGNLASIDRAASRSLFGILTAYLVAERFDWAVFTGCRALTQLFNRLGISTVTLGRALQARLPVDLQTWGGYYEDNPQVVAGPVRGGLGAFVLPEQVPAGGRLS